jgi:hypothetical protein
MRLEFRVASFPERRRISRLSVLPAALRREILVDHHTRDALVLRRDVRIEHARSSSLASVPARSTTAATGVSPHLGSGMPNTATSRTADGRAATFLDVARIYLDAAGIDHVLLAVDEIEEAVLVDIAEVATVQPAVA